MKNEDYMLPSKTKSTYTFHAEFKDEQRIEFKRLTYTQAKTLNALFDDKFDMVGGMQLSRFGWKLNEEATNNGIQNS